MFNKNRFAQILKNISETFENQRDFSKKSEINRTYLSQYMNMKIDKPPKPEILKRIADNSKGVTTYEELMAICGYINIDNFLKEKYELKLLTFSFNEKQYRKIIDIFCSDLFNFIRIDLTPITKKALTVLCDFLIQYMSYHKSNLVDTDSITIEWLFDEDNIPDDLYSNFKDDIIYISNEYTKKILSLLDENKIVNNSNKVTIKDIIKIPVVGTVAAGEPILAEQNIIDYEELPAEEFKDGDYFGLKIKGDSMLPRILERDVVIVRQQNDCDNGQVAVVLINGDEATVKQIKKTESGIMLIPFNNKYDPMFFTKEEIETKPVKIIGVVKRLIGYNFG